ncbi:SDR family NAD(P)-dependent oxidoreductase [Maridesulfovibrio salexigens]|uniref:Short-chain dehydrogenase/reductase SDR n=1 Tax=Maridesulfovibrio salexigens (strain ATCC 14822 / DSM 2638 / NCIMB 8403 / VKM B-1763) TaxID=526222 RepID=C6BXT4_MARSD|nr:3-oxoacyl-ACP reductase family protein [Maridesulfovibrio salexigens]ACS78642.1 short-chain dehydrogenase/reductase SDR [Maridesulfovibrio salexigens DSM 2638]
MQRLKNKIALVTGGGRGIGKAISHKLAAEGAQVILTWVNNRESAEQTATEISKEGGKARILQLEVSDADSVDAVVADITANEGMLDVLVNNAGINDPQDFDKITPEEWDRIMSVNLKGPFLCTQRCLDLLKKSKGASVINIGSVSGQYGGPRTAHYAASKAGLISMTQVAARFGAEWNIRCNTVAAGLVISDMADAGLQNPAVQKAAENVLLKRFATASEVADSVAYLASDESSYITAQTINVNGGLYF